MNILIIRSIKDDSSLSHLSLNNIKDLHKYDHVKVLYNDGTKENWSRFPKEEDYINIDYISTYDDLNEFALLLRKIELAHKVAHPDSKDLTRIFIGMWLFDYINEDKFNIQLLSNKNWNRLSRSADEFIENDFGMSSVVVLNNDGTKRTDRQAKTISGSDGERDAICADSGGMQGQSQDR